MKKLIIAAVALASAAAFAALDFGGATPTLVLAPTSIEANATNVVEFASMGRKGIAEVYVAASAAETNAAVAVTLYTSNIVTGAWSVYASSTFTTTPTNAAYRLPFAAEYLSPVNRLAISPTTGLSASAIILAY